MWFKEVYFNGNNWVYLIKNQRKKFKVWIRELSNGRWQLYDPEWVNFIKKSGYENIFVLHFINESIDTYYFTAYNAEGVESGGYGKLYTQKRSARCMAIVGQNPMESPVRLL